MNTLLLLQILESSQDTYIQMRIAFARMCLPSLCSATRRSEQHLHTQRTLCRHAGCPTTLVECTSGITSITVKVVSIGHFTTVLAHPVCLHMINSPRQTQWSPEEIPLKRVRSINHINALTKRSSKADAEKSKNSGEYREIRSMLQQVVMAE